MRCYLFPVLVAFGLHATAQTVFIPDTNLRAWLNNAKPNSVDINGSCDTANWNAQPPAGVYCPTYTLPDFSTVDFEGIQYLKMGWLQITEFSNTITKLWPGAPPQLEQLSLEGADVNNFSPSLFPLPSGMMSFYCSNCGISQLPAFDGQFMTIEGVDLAGQALVVPPSLVTLALSGCNLSQAPSSLANVSSFRIDNNPLTSWANLPGNVVSLFANNVGLSTPPPISGSTTLTYIELSYNGHTSIPALPPTLERLVMNSNQLTTVPSLAASNLVLLNVNENPLTALPQLPSTLEYLYAKNTAITTLPNPLPPSLKQLNMSGNQVTTIPPLPAGFQWLWIDDSQVSQLPAFPAGFLQLDALDATALTCLPALPTGMYRAKLAGSGVTCLPNIPPQFDIAFNTLGIAPVVCDPGNSPCPIVDPLITGTTFADADVDGVFDAGEAVRPNATVVAQPGDLMAGSDANGRYALPANIGSFSITGVPGLYEPVTNAPYAVTFTALGQVDSLNHIGFNLIPGLYDLVTTVTGNIVRPGFNTGVWVHVENVGTEPTTAAVQLTFDPALTFNGSSIAPDAINGNVLDWNVAAIAPGTSWTVWVDLYGPPTLVLGDPMVHQATATPSQPDQTIADNTDVLNDVVVGSYDPNDKQVEPAYLSLTDVAAFTRLHYTVRFQNTGTFMAERVLITDTLSSDLYWTTINVEAASHAHTWYLHNGVLHVLFENINLPDSTSDEPGSHGFVKFSFVASQSLVTGDVVDNVANIYFDFNEPIITNTASTFVNTALGVDATSTNGVVLWPVPATDVLRVQSYAPMQRVQVLDRTGRMVRDAQASGLRTTIDVRDLSAGAYAVRCTTEKGVVQRMFVR